MHKSLAVAGVNFRVSKLAYLITGILLASVLINLPINIAVGSMSTGDVENFQPSPGFYLYLLVALFAIFVPALYFRKYMNLGLKKSAYIGGCAISYVILSFGVSVLSLLSYLTLDKLLTVPPISYIWHPFQIFGWENNGLVVGFFQQFAFLLLVAAAAHLLTTIQTFWYGWLADIVIVAIIAVFTPIPVLRGVLIAFFNFIIFTPYAFVQISACLLLSIALYLLSIVPVKQKPV